MTGRKVRRISAAVAALGVIIVIAFLAARERPVYQAAALPEPEPVKPPPPAVDEFGFEEGAYEVIDRSVRRNETFAEILTGHNVDYSTVVELARMSSEVLDVRKIRAGQPIRIYRDDSLRTARRIVYQHDPVRYVVFDLDRMQAYEREREVRIEQKQVSGTITGSLYATMARTGLADRLVPVLVSELAEVFAWQIDFYRVQKGDEFSVIYEEELIDGKPVGLGRVVAASFVQSGEEYYGFFFDEGERPDYYDEEGNSLRKAFLKAPLKYKRISSRYTKRRFHPVQKRYKPHLGTDYAADPGTPIRTVGDGVVLEARFARGNGNYVKIRHNGTYTTAYLHMSRIQKGMKPGTRVRQGEIIGYVGSTGLATGPHVCFRFWKNGVQVDPLKEQIPPAHPVDPELKSAFLEVRDRLMKQLKGEQATAILADAAGTEKPDVVM